MKKTFYFSMLCMIWVASSGGCNGRQCDLVCQNGGVLRVNDDNCHCDCPPGYSGNRCENTANTNKHRLHADIKYTVGGRHYSYDPTDCFIHVYDHATDTLWIDGDDTATASNSYCFLRLYIGDHTSIANGSSFPIRSDNGIGSCWAAYRDSANNVFSVDPSNPGTLKINMYDPGNVIGGTFQFYGKNGNTIAEISGWFEDYD